MKIKKELFSLGSVFLLAGVAVTCSYGVDSRNLERTSNLKAGSVCAETQEGGRGCDEADTADGITDGSPCQSEGEVMRNCPTVKGAVIVQGTTKWSEAKIKRVPCAKPQIAYLCVVPVDADNMPMPDKKHWEKTAGSCGEKDAFDGTAPNENDPGCTPTPTPTPNGA